MNLQKLYKIVRTLLIDITYMALAFISTQYGWSGPTNLFLFGTWLSFVVYVSLAFTYDEGIENYIPSNVKRANFLFIILLLVWHSWFLSASIWLLNFLTYEHLVKRYLENKIKEDMSKTMASGNIAYTNGVGPSP